MSGPFIPHDVTQFIVAKIDSVAQLEALLLLRHNPEEQWCVRVLASRLYIDEQQTAELLSDMCLKGLAIAIAGEPPRYQYKPSSIELRQMIERIAEIYSKHIVPITNVIHSKPKSRVQEFADAFKFRKDE